MTEDLEGWLLYNFKQKNQWIRQLNLIAKFFKEEKWWLSKLKNHNKTEMKLIERKIISINLKSL